MLEEECFSPDTELRLISTPGECIKDREITEAIQGQLVEPGIRALPCVGFAFPGDPCLRVGSSLAAWQWHIEL